MNQKKFLFLSGFFMTEKFGNKKEFLKKFETPNMFHSQNTPFILDTGDPWEGKNLCLTYQLRTRDK